MPLPVEKGRFVWTSTGKNNLGGQGVFLIAATWLLKATITSRLAQDTEAFKTKLKAESDTEIERLKNSLQMVALEHQVRFSKLHEKRAEVIAELYKRLVNVYWNGKRFVLTSENNATHAQTEEFKKTAQEV